MRVVAGEAKGRRLRSPPASVTRAATDRVRQSLFGILEPVLEGARVLDLFAGAGTLGIEALSRGAAHATFVERDAAALRALRANVASTEMSGRAHVVARDVLPFLGSSPAEPYDVVFCDPPFADVAVLTRVLAHDGLRGSLAPGALVVARMLRKHPPALPEGARLEREKRIGEESLWFLRYDAARPT
jgi:16S rRNA (guanine966-N2)-methyltransferase